MDRLTIHGINVDMSASELERSNTRQLTVDSISSIRNALFTEAMESGLVSVGDILVKRRKMNSGKTVKQKHVSDIWLLVRAIKSKASIPQTLLRNGKLSKGELSASQVRHQATLEQTNTVITDQY